MHQHIVTLFCMTLLAVSVIAAPAKSFAGYHNSPNQFNGKRSFKIARPKRAARDGPRELRKAYEKYGLGASLPNIDFNALAFSNFHHTAKTNAANATDDPAGTGEVATNPVPGNTEFLTAVTVGGQKLVMDFDTGSSDM